MVATVVVVELGVVAGGDVVLEVDCDAVVTSQRRPRGRRHEQHADDDGDRHDTHAAQPARGRR